jgi:hypothetical protein
MSRSPECPTTSAISRQVFDKGCALVCIQPGSKSPAAQRSELTATDTLRSAFLRAKTQFARMRRCKSPLDETEGSLRSAVTSPAARNGPSDLAVLATPFRQNPIRNGHGIAQAIRRQLDAQARTYLVGYNPASTSLSCSGIFLACAWCRAEPVKASSTEELSCELARCC